MAFILIECRKKSCLALVYKHDLVIKNYIPELHFSFKNSIFPLSFSFTAECIVIIKALILILKLATNKFLIVFDYRSCH